MHRLFRLGMAALIALFAVGLVGRSTIASAAPATCTANLTIFTTTPGTITMEGETTHVRDSGVGGQYTAGFLAGSTFTGAQDFVVNNTNRASQLQGGYTITGPEGTLMLRYTGHADLTTGTATGHFVTTGGTEKFADFHWEGDISAQLVGLTPPTFIVTDSGPCHFAP